MKRNNRHTSNSFLAFFSRPLDTCGACGRVLAGSGQCTCRLQPSRSREV